MDDLDADLAAFNAAIEQVHSDDEQPDDNTTTQPTTSQPTTTQPQPTTTPTAKKKVVGSSQVIGAAPTLNPEYIKSLYSGVGEAALPREEQPSRTQPPSSLNTNNNTGDDNKPKGPTAVELGINHQMGYEQAKQLELQQSVYSYDPNRKVSTSTGVVNDDGAQEAPKKRKHVRAAGGEVWEDETLNEWPENDYRLFIGDLGNEVTDEMLSAQFSSFKSFAKAKVVRNKRSKKSKGFGFVSFLDPFEMLEAVKTKNGKYCGNRPMKIRKSTWQERDMKSQGKKKRKR